MIKVISREQAIEDLTIISCDSCSGGDNLYDIIKNGFKGYNTYTNEELNTQYNEYFQEYVEGYDGNPDLVKFVIDER